MEKRLGNMWEKLTEHKGYFSKISLCKLILVVTLHL